MGYCCNDLRGSARITYAWVLQSWSKPRVCARDCCARVCLEIDSGNTVRSLFSLRWIEQNELLDLLQFIE
jgi:hypothetical protein